MKPIILLLFSVVFIFSCSEKKEKQEENTITNSPLAPVETFVNRYEIYIKALDTSDVTSISTAAKEYEVFFAEAEFCTSRFWFCFV